MPEYIERKAFKAEVRRLSTHYLNEWDTLGVLAAVDRIPAADVRPVVLCRDCKWTKTDEMEDPAIYCEKWDRWEMPPDAFCYLGKHREAPDA